MVIWVALCAACGLTIVSLRSMAYAVSHAVEVDSQPSHGERPRSMARGAARQATVSRREVFFLCVEIAIAVGIALSTIGLAAAAAMPGHLLIGALLAQVAVLGALIAPPVVVCVGSIGLRPAALALGVAQLAQLAFFVRAIQALL